MRYAASNVCARRRVQLPASNTFLRFPVQVRADCGLADDNREDDPMIGMLLDRYSWDHARVVELFKSSLQRRNDLGMSKVREEIVSGNLGLQQLPHADEVRQVVAINGSTSAEKASTNGAAAAGESVIVDGKALKFGDVIGCYELRYGHQGQGSVPAGGQGGESSRVPVSPDQFTKYMVYVTQWRWLQCEHYIRRHGELGFWSMIHDISCPEVLPANACARVHPGVRAASLRPRPPLHRLTDSRAPLAQCPGVHVAVEPGPEPARPVHATSGGGLCRPLSSNGAEDTDHQRASHLWARVVGHLGSAAAASQGPDRPAHHLVHLRRGGGKVRAPGAHAPSLEGGAAGWPRLKTCRSARLESWTALQRRQPILPPTVHEHALASPCGDATASSTPECKRGRPDIVMIVTCDKVEKGRRQVKTAYAYSTTSTWNMYAVIRIRVKHMINSYVHAVYTILVYS